LATLIDTDIAIELRDGSPWAAAKISQLEAPLLVSAITRVELENGVRAVPAEAEIRQLRVDRILQTVETLDFGIREIDAYRRILAITGYSRRKIADRMTAATALAHGIPLATLNGRDFLDVPDLELIAWERPAKISDQQ
jgi:tRNA(fMet)-specific endonuclease VapC